VIELIWRLRFEGSVMPIKTHGIIVDKAIEASQAESAPSVLALLTTPSDARVKRYLHERKLERYRQRIAESGLALTRHRDRHSDLERQLLEEEAKDQIEPPPA
jgi:hypothetical protein